MLRSLFLVSVLSVFFIIGCGKQSSIVGPISEKDGAVSIMVNNGAVGGLRKAAAIELQTLEIVMSATGQTSITKTLALSGNGQSSGSALFEGLEPNIIWTITATSYDTNDIIIHQGSTTCTPLPDTTIDVSLTLDSKYAMINATFSGLSQEMDSCKLKVDGVEVGKHVLTIGDITAGSIIISYDYVTTNVGHTITMEIYGTKWAQNGLFYTGDLVITPTPGTTYNETITLVYVGPGKGKTNITVTLGSVGTINVTGDTGQ